MKPTIRCSGLDDFFRCHGSRLARARVGEVMGRAATAGNWGHYEAATRLMNEFEAGHFDERGEPAPLAAPKMVSGWVPSWFDLWMVDFYLGAIRDSMDVDMLLEVEVALAWEFSRFILSGHLDALAISPDGRFAKAWDLKTGEVPVDAADENWQVLGYTLLLFLAYSDLQEVTFYIVQPRNDEDDGWERVSEVTVKRAQVAGLLETLETEVGNGLDHAMELATGWKQCRYCAAGTQCEAIKELAQHMKHLMTTGELEAIRQSPDLDKLIETYLDLKTLNAVHDNAAEEVKARVEAAGGAVAFGGGRRAYFKEGNGGRVCTDMAKAQEALTPVLGADFIACTKLKFEDAEKACAKALGLPHKSKLAGKASGQSELKDRLVGIVEQKPKRTLMIE